MRTDALAMVNEIAKRRGRRSVPLLEPAALLVPEFHGIGLRLLFRWKLIGRYLRDMKIAEDGPVSLLAFGFVPEEDLVGLTQPDAVGLVTIVSLEDKQEGRGAGTEIGGMDQGGKGILCGLAALHERLAMATLAYVWGEIGVRAAAVAWISSVFRGLMSVTRRPF